MSEDFILYNDTLEFEGFQNFQHFMDENMSILGYYILENKNSNIIVPDITGSKGTKYYNSATKEILRVLGLQDKVTIVNSCERNNKYRESTWKWTPAKSIFYNKLRDNLPNFDTGPKKVYIKRTYGILESGDIGGHSIPVRRIVNEDEFCEVLISNGFEIFDFHDKSFEYKKSILQNAEEVIMQTSAAAINLFLCEKAVSVTLLTNDVFKMGSYFFNFLPNRHVGVITRELSFESLDKDKFTDNLGLPNGSDNCNFNVVINKVFPRVACLMINYSTSYNDNFIVTNAINSFVKWHPDVEMIYIDKKNYELYKPNDEHTNKSIVRVQIIRDLLESNKYDKVIMLGLDTITCDRLYEFLYDNTADILCSSGPNIEIKTEQWTSPTVKYMYSKQYNTTILEKLFINADVCCFNSYRGAKIVAEKSIEYYNEQAEQGGLNYCFLNQNILDIKVNIVDFPYFEKNFTYNVKSKGIASGGESMKNGFVTTGMGGACVSFIYPTTRYYVKNEKLYTEDNKQIKVFHIAEALGCKNLEDRTKILNEIKTIWFNKRTVNFFNQLCGCSFPSL